MTKRIIVDMSKVKPPSKNMRKLAKDMMGYDPHAPEDKKKSSKGKSKRSPY